MSGRRGDSGSATVLVLAVCAVLAGTGAVLAGWGLAAVTRERAGLVADAAALAGAAQVTAGPGPACRVAAEVAASNGGRLLDCRVAGAIVTVQARTSPPPWIAWAGPAVGRARAGPATDAEKAEEPP
ncbi:MAG TPA: Rv3654c family TadE-like protein [Mycobacteriales bacterium]|nr:Rv3654c family TadE-like protein [Mycobacteriales bacterium]